jgi:hypothetical protein
MVALKNRQFRPLLKEELIIETFTGDMSVPGRVNNRFRKYMLIPFSVRLLSPEAFFFAVCKNDRSFICTIYLVMIGRLSVYNFLITIYDTRVISKFPA